MRNGRDFAGCSHWKEDRGSPNKGGSVGCCLEQHAAICMYGRRLCAIALFVFRAGGSLANFGP